MSTIRLSIVERSQAQSAAKPEVYEFEEAVIFVGRDPSCNVVLPQKSVSRKHAKLTRDGTLYFVEDLESAFGTVIKNKKLKPLEKVLLQNGDVVAIGTYDITFERIAASKDKAERTAMVARKMVKDVMRGGSQQSGTLPYLRVMSGPTEGQHIEIADAKEYVFGRDETCEIILNDDLVSRKHAKIRRDWAGTHVEDLGSRNGIKVNKDRVTKATLKDRDELVVGGVRFLFIDPSDVRELPKVSKGEEESTAAPSPEEVPVSTKKGQDEQPPPVENKPAAKATPKDDEDEEDDDEQDEPEEDEDDQGPPVPQVGGIAGLLQDKKKLAIVIGVFLVTVVVIAFMAAVVAGA